MKDDDKLPRTYQKTNEMGFTETSTVFPVLPDPEEPPTPKTAKIINTTKKIGWIFWIILTTVSGFVAWMVINHDQ